MTDQRMLYVNGSRVSSRRRALRMLFPSEQDLMAQMGGLKLVRRMANWRGGSWHADRNGPETSNVISVYARAQVDGRPGNGDAA